MNQTEDYFTRLDKWDGKVAEYERLSGDEISDKIMAGVLSSVLAPKDMAKHLALHAGRLVTYQQVREEIEGYTDANESLTTEAAAMDSSSLTKDGSKLIDPWRPPKGGGKGGKRNEKGKGKGWGFEKGKDGWRPQSRDPWQNRPHYQKGKKGDKGKGGGKKGGQAKGSQYQFQGECNWCGRW